MNKYIHSSLHSKNKNTPSSTLLLDLIYLEYIHGVIDHIYKILAKNYIKTPFKPHKILKHISRTAKDTSDPMLGQGVYQISCSSANPTLTKHVDQSKPTIKNL